MIDEEYLGDPELAYELHRRYDEEWVGEGFERTEVVSAFNLGTQMTGGDLSPGRAKLKRENTGLDYADAIKIMDGHEEVTNFLSYDTE